MLSLHESTQLGETLGTVAAPETLYGMATSGFLSPRRCSQREEVPLVVQSLAVWVPRWKVLQLLFRLLPFQLVPFLHRLTCGI